MTRRQRTAYLSFMAALSRADRAAYIDMLVTDLVEWRVYGNN